MGKIIVRPYKAGEASYVSYLQMRFYENTYGFKQIFEHYLLSAMAEFTGLAIADSQLWVAVDGEKIVGSIAIVKTAEQTAQLRWFLVDEKYQGKKVGKKLMEIAMQFCAEKNYTHVFLWTFSTLEVARHIYGSYGFKLTETKPNTEWSSTRLTEEKWERLL